MPEQPQEEPLSVLLQMPPNSHCTDLRMSLKWSLENYESCCRDATQPPVSLPERCHEAASGVTSARNMSQKSPKSASGGPRLPLKWAVGPQKFAAVPQKSAWVSSVVARNISELLINKPESLLAILLSITEERSTKNVWEQSWTVQRIGFCIWFLCQSLMLFR